MERTALPGFRGAFVSIASLDLGVDRKNGEGGRMSCAFSPSFLEFTGSWIMRRVHRHLLPGSSRFFTNSSGNRCNSSNRAFFASPKTLVESRKRSYEQRLRVARSNFVKF
jgi:hypothetical protein